MIFANEILPEVDLKRKKEARLASEPFWKRLEEVDPDLHAEIERLKKVRFYKRLSKMPLVNRFLKKRIGRFLSELEEQGILVDYHTERFSNLTGR